MEPYATRSDEELMQVFQQGDEHAFAELYNRHFVPLHQALAASLDPERAYELAHTVFVRIYLINRPS